MILDFSPHVVIETAVKEGAIIKETIHSEADIWVVDLSAAFGYNTTSIMSVVHHYQNHWFTHYKDRDSGIRWFKKSEKTFKLVKLLDIELRL